MNKTPRLSKSGIEYLDYSWGIFSGCRNLEKGVCPVKACWAKGICLHYPRLYPDGFKPHYYPEAINSPLHLKKPSRIGVGWAGDIIGYGLEYRDEIFDTILNCLQHTFLFLTKNSECLSQWSPFPDNCFVGQTITRNLGGIGYMADFEARVKFISFEPLLYYDVDVLTASELFRVNGIKQVIIGGQTKPTRLPELNSVKLIVEAADKAEAKVFLKDSLFDLLPLDDGPFYQPVEDGDHYQLRQEMPD